MPLLRRVATNEFSPAFQGRDQSVIKPVVASATIECKEEPLPWPTPTPHFTITSFSPPRIVSPGSCRILNSAWAFIGGIARTHNMTALQVGGVEDHVHALVTAPPTIAPFQIAQFLKGESSKWIHEEFSALRDFGWQDGYGAFTVSKSNLPDVISYILNQREHHRQKTFQEEYLDFLQKNGIGYDERYLWG